MLETAKKDEQSVTAEGRTAGSPIISGVVLREGANVLTRSGSMTEVFRMNWPEAPAAPGQVNWVWLWSGAVTDWHCHIAQTDHVFPVLGLVKLCLYDDRNDSPTRGLSNVFRLGALRPTLVIIPPYVWHAFRNESGEPAGFINYFQAPYRHEDPDNWRLPHDSPAIPCRL
jgi:dTDP-4-dehydrorhamnose 3,5-epimerase